MTPIFVGGSQRSGTNLLQTILCQDPKTNRMIHESQYLTQIMSVYSWSKARIRENTADYFDDLTGLASFHRDLIRRLLANVWQLHGKPEHLVLKHPELTRFFPELFELLGDCKFVCMIRDPRDTIASMLKVARRLHAENQNPGGFPGSDINALCQHYVSYYAPLLSSADPLFKKQVLFVRYEDLVGSPEETLGSLRLFTKLALKNIDPHAEFDTGTLDYENASDQWRPWITEHYGQPITQSQVGSYQSVLSETDLSSIESKCHYFFQHFGYPVSPE